MIKYMFNKGVAIEIKYYHFVGYIYLNNICKIILIIIIYFCKIFLFLPKFKVFMSLFAKF